MVDGEPTSKSFKEILLDKSNILNQTYGIVQEHYAPSEGAQNIQREIVFISDNQSLWQEDTICLSLR